MGSVLKSNRFKYEISHIIVVMIKDRLEIRHLHLSTVDSTQDFIQRELKNIDPSLLFAVTADEQTRGHGQGNKSWFSPNKKNVYLSFHFISKPSPNLAQLLSISALSVLLELGVNARFKWPNDLLVDDKKIAGAIAKMCDDHHAVLGIGLNVLLTSDECNKIDQKATSLLIETKKKIHPHAIAEKIILQFREDLFSYTNLGFSFFNDQINSHLAYKNELIYLEIRNEKIKGTLVEINNEGALVIEINKIKKTYFTGSIKPYFLE